MEIFGQFAPIDQVWVSGETLAVKEARELVAQVIQQPFGTYRLLVITKADQLSEAVQNTLLKILEEPPSFLAIVLAAANSSALLATVQSRLHPLASPIAPVIFESSADLFTDQNTARKTLEVIKDRRDLAERLATVLGSLRSDLFDLPTRETIEKVELLDRSIKRLNHNANQKLVIDALLLNWPFKSSTSED